MTTKKSDEHNSHSSKTISKLKSEGSILRLINTQLESAKKDLKDSEKRYRRLFEEANDSIFIMNDKVFTECNRRTLSIFGCDKSDDIVGHSPVEFSPANQPDGQKSSVKAKKYIKAAFNGVKQEFYWKHSKKNGELFDAEVSLKRFVTNGERYLQATVRDITKRRTFERQLKESEEKFKTVVANAQAVIFMLDKKGQFLLSEGKALSLLGLKPGQVVGMSAFDMYRDYPEVAEGIRGALKGKFYEGIIFIQDIYFDIFFSPFVDEKGEIKGVIGMAVDVTKQEKIAAELREIDKMKTQFISLASHQLRSPLGSMRWNLEMILSDPILEKQPNFKSKIQDVYTSNVRAVNLINDLLDVADIEQDQVYSSPKKIDIIEMINSILEEARLEINHKKLKFVFSKPSDKLMIKADEKMLREVIQNLMSNAIKYNDVNGRILLALEKKSKVIKINIANTGLVISKKDKNKVFEKFFRSSEAVKKDPDGTGLGLFLVKSYIDKWGGKISFESPKKFGIKSIDGDKFKGTVFSIEIPLSSAKKLSARH